MDVVSNSLDQSESLVIQLGVKRASEIPKGKLISKCIIPSLSNTIFKIFALSEIFFLLFSGYSNKFLGIALLRP